MTLHKYKRALDRLDKLERYYLSIGDKKRAIRLNWTRNAFVSGNINNREVYDNIVKLHYYEGK